MLRIGIAGIGFMGMIHYLAYRKVRGAKVVALCSRDPKKLAGDWRCIQGNFGPAGTKMDLAGVRTYQRLDDMLADPGIDLVDICLPPGQHSDATVAALQAGKHVLCEKPIALQLTDAKRMVAAAAKARRQLLIAHVLPFNPEYAFAVDAVTSGKYGKLLGGHCKRVISDPSWLPNFYDPQVVGGPMIDLHIHDAHFIRLLAGMPSRVQTAGRMRGQVAEFFDSQFQFADPAVHVTATSGAVGQQGRSFTHAFEIYLERATLLYDFAVLGGEPTTNVPLTLLNDKGRALRPKIKPLDPIDTFARQLTDAVHSVSSGRPSAILDGHLACAALQICEAETASLASGKPVKIRSL